MLENLNTIYSLLLIEFNHVKIVNPKIDFKSRQLIVHESSCVFQIKELQKIVDPNVNVKEDDETEKEILDLSYEKLNHLSRSKYNPFPKNMAFVVEILEKRSEGRFLVGDESSECEMITHKLQPKYLSNIKENWVIKVVNPQINLNDQWHSKLVLTKESAVYQEKKRISRSVECKRTQN